MASGSQRESSNKQDTEDTEYKKLYRAVDNGDLESMNKILEHHPNALTASLSTDGNTAIHIAVLAGRGKVVKALLNRLGKKDLEIKNRNGSTALNFAAMGGVTKIAEYLVRKNPELPSIPNQNGYIPVVVASHYGHDDMVRYLYSVTPKKELDPDTGKNGAVLFTSTMDDDVYDIPMDMLRYYSKLVYAQDEENDMAIDLLAQNPTGFPSGTQLAFWRRWIYSCIYIHDPMPHYMDRGDIGMPNESPAEHKSFSSRALNPLFDVIWKSLKLFVPSIMQIYELKLRHVQSQELLSRVCREMSRQEETQSEKVKKVIFKAVKYGIVEVVLEIMKYYPDIIWCYDDQNRNIFSFATRQRQEKIFSLIYTMADKKNSLASNWDNHQNNILHQAAYLAPPSQLDLVSGAALQMQRELQWFKEVELLVQPKYKEMENRLHLNPQVLFANEHKQLVKEGEKWMKETAQSCTVAAALIATITFAAAFTVPGGYDDSTGIPLYLNRNSFMVFMISDAFSFFSSCTSVLMFLAILTSRYRENDFLISLPRKLIIGLSSLVFSIATMMVTFGVTLVILLRERMAWISFPVILMASLPVTLFALLQLPTFVEIFWSTYGPGIFKRPKKPAVDN